MGSSEEAGLVNKAKESFLQHLLKNKESVDFGDFTIACGESHWKVHRIVVCLHSDYFRKACQSVFKEGDSGFIQLKEENPVVIAKLIDYFYGFDYDDRVSDCDLNDSGDNSEDNSEDNNEDNSEDNSEDNNHDNSGVNNTDSNEDNQKQPTLQDQKLAFNALMYVAGDKYDISGLKLLAKAKFSAALVDGWDKEDLSEIIRFIYTNTLSSDRGLRECLMPILIQHKRFLRADHTFMKVVETVGMFAVDLIDAWTNPNEHGTVTTCYNCSIYFPPSNSYCPVCRSSGYLRTNNFCSS
ncbi:MAG: hypothetical protein Q9171_000014 [Xanthocarpia ochracea]